MEPRRAWGCFGANRGKELAVEVGNYFIPDFRSGSRSRRYFQ